MCFAPRYKNGAMAVPLFACTNVASRFETLCAHTIVGTIVMIAHRAMILKPSVGLADINGPPLGLRRNTYRARDSAACEENEFTARIFRKCNVRGRPLLTPILLP